jgi:hypothetical protein
MEETMLLKLQIAVVVALLAVQVCGLYKTHQFRLKVQADCRVFMVSAHEDPARCD